MPRRRVANRFLLTTALASFATLAWTATRDGDPLGQDTESNHARAATKTTWAEVWIGDEYAPKLEGATKQEPTTPPEPPGGEQAGDQEGGDGRPEKKKEPRPGIPVTDPLVIKACSTCHQVDDEGLMGRISHMRKTPEGWEISLKRMLRLQNLLMTPDEAKQVLRYLANEHGLARAEAEGALYEVERRVHWSEEQHDEELRETCGKCHTLGRVLSERRDAEEWKLLKATHLAFFPVADFQAFRGNRRGFEGIDFESMSEAEIEEAVARRRESGRGQDRADRVLAKLAEELPLFTPEWKAWQVNRREVPIAGTWTVIGHDPGRGGIHGHVEITRVEEDSYDTRWEISYGGRPKVVREGKGLLFAGYSWRGRSTTQAPGEAGTLREVLLLDEDWNRFQGRVFSGSYNELGSDITLHRRTGATRIFGASVPGQDGAALMIPSKGQGLTILGEAFPEDVVASDFVLGGGVTVTGAERLDAGRVRLTVDVEPGAVRGKRMVSFRSLRGPEVVVLYDTIDYIEVTPREGFARVGGTMRPPQIERFEAQAMNRGPDGEPYTDDDYRVMIVPAQWSLEEFPIREGDDDVRFVGGINTATGVFTPNLDGPNPQRRWQANNIGDVYVVAVSRLAVQELPGPGPDGEQPPPPATATMVEREFRARGHLIVTVPLYVQWDRYEWDTR